MDLSGARTQPVWDVFSTLVYAVKESDVSLTMVDGRVLWDGRSVRTVDDAEDAARSGRVAARRSRPRSGESVPKMSLFVRTIVKKRDGGELSEGEIADFVSGRHGRRRSPTSRRPRS